ELAAKNRFAAVERVTADFDVVESLKKNAHGREPHQRAAVFGGDGRAEQPLTAADGRGAEDNARTDHGKDIAQIKARHVDQLARVPPRHGLGTRVRRGEHWLSRGRSGRFGTW